MNGKPLSKVGNRSLGAGISGNFCKRCVSVHRAYVKDCAAFAADHILCKSLSGQKCTDKIEVKHKLHILVTEIKERLCISINIADLKIFLVCCGTGVVSACAVNENIALAQLFENFLVGCCNAL